MVKRFSALALLLAAVLAVFSYPATAQVTFDYNPPALGSSEAVKRNDLNAELDGINGAKQAVDADLTCLAGLTSAADKLAYFTGSGTCAVTDFSAFARTLVDDADAATARTTLGLVIGTNVQAFDADLTTYAGITPAANTQSLLAAANYAAMRALLDLEAGTDFYSIAAANAAFQPLDADLTTWAGVTPSANGQSLVSAADYAAMRTQLSLVPGTNVQAFDADLSTWATLTPSANAQNLVTAADYAAMRTLLSLVPGTNVQAFDADLSTWAGVTPSANGQSIVAAANYAAMRALLDLEAGTDFYSIAAADTAFLSASEIDTSAEIAAIVGDETGTGAVVFGTSPTLAGTPVIGDGSGNDKLSFTPETSDPTCSAGNYFLWANSTAAKLKKCQDGVVSDIAPAGGGGGGLADAYDRMTDGTTTATAASNDIFKFRGANGIAVTVQSNDATHGDNVLIDGSGAGDVDGPGSATDNAITRYDGTTGKLVQDSGVTISDGGEILAVAGTTTEAPIKLQAGTNLTAAEDGAIEMDGEALYATTDADNRGVVRVVNYIAQDSTRTLTSSVAEQAIFDETTNGRITLETGLYRFECQLSMGSMSTTSGNAAFDLMGTGSATLGSIAYTVAGQDANANTVGAVGGSHSTSAQTGASMVTAATSTNLGVNIRGSFRVTSGGTLVPSVTLVTAAAATVLAGSYCGFERMGGSATSVGQWD